MIIMYPKSHVTYFFSNITNIYIFTINFNGSSYRLGKHMHLVSKHSEIPVKAKRNISICFSYFVLILTYV